MPHLQRDERDRRALSARRTLASTALAALLIASTGAPQSQPAQASSLLTLDEILREIAAHSTAAVTSRLDIGTAKAGTNRAEAMYRPTVSLTTGFQARDNEVVARFGELQAPETERNFFTGELDLGYLLWDGGRRASALAGSKDQEGATAARGQADVRSSQLEGLSTYVRILTLKAQGQVVAQRVAALKDHLREVQDLFSQGVVARNDLLATEVRLRLVQDQAGDVDNAGAVAAQALNRMMGRKPSDPVALPERLPSPPPLPAGPEDLKKRAAKNNAQMLALRARLKTQVDAVSLRRSESYPTVFAQASHTYEQDKFLVHPNANVLFLGLSWQAYDGGARQANVREADFAAARTREEIADLQRQLEVQVEQAYRDYNQAVLEAATAETNVKAAEENLRIEEDQYKAGLARTTDVLDAESVLADSRFSLANQHYNAYLKQGVLLTIAGEDLPAFFAGVGSRGQEQ